MPQAGSSFAASTEAVSATPAETAYEDLPLTSSALLPRPLLRGSLMEAAYASGFQLVLAREQYPVLQHRCTLCTVPVYKPLCMQ